MIFKVLAVIVSYLLGNINPAILVSRALGGDIREKGSGNAGTTNMLRVYGKKAAAATLLIDIFKGTLAVIIGRFAGGESLAYACGFAAICGHIWPAVWGFKGGKGIATGLGIILGISPLYALCELAIAVIFFVTTKMVSPGSLAAAAALPILALKFAPGFKYYALVMALIVIFKHRSNIKKLINHEESKLSFKK